MEIDATVAILETVVEEIVISPISNATTVIRKDTMPGIAQTRLKTRIRQIPIPMTLNLHRPGCIKAQVQVNPKRKRLMGLSISGVPNASWERHKSPCGAENKAHVTSECFKKNANNVTVNKAKNEGEVGNMARTDSQEPLQFVPFI